VEVRIVDPAFRQRRQRIADDPQSEAPLLVVAAAAGGGESDVTGAKGGGVDGARPGGVLVDTAEDGLRRLAGLLGQGTISISVGACYSLEQAGQALEQARHGSHGAATVLLPGDLVHSP
jgi:hypothetical protein